MAWKNWESFVPNGELLPDGRVRAAKPSKYRNVKTSYEGLVFDSAKECRRWQELKMLEKAGEVMYLHRQVPFSIDVNGQFVCRYYADFYYVERESGNKIVEDCKGVKTQVYALKKRLMKAVHGIEIREV